MADRDVRGAERPSRSRLEGTLANHVTVHVTATYKVERATTQPDPSSSRIVSSSSSSSFPLRFGPPTWLGVYQARRGPNPPPKADGRRRRRRCSLPAPRRRLLLDTVNLLPLRPCRRGRGRGPRGRVVSPAAPIWASPALTPPDSPRADAGLRDRRLRDRLLGISTRLWDPRADQLSTSTSAPCFWSGEANRRAFLDFSRALLRCGVLYLQSLPHTV